MSAGGESGSDANVAGFLNERTYGWLFNRDERWLLERMQNHARIYVVDPERQKTLKDLERRGYCIVTRGDGSGMNRGLMIAEATLVGRAAQPRARTNIGGFND